MWRGSITKLLSAERKKSLEAMTREYQEDLRFSEIGLSYLNGRGISIEVAEAYRLGFVADPDSPYNRMISIPYIRPAGVIAIKFRRIDDGKPKYLSAPGCGAHLYNTRALQRAGRVVAVCEGEFDTIVLESLCGISAVGVPGVSHWRAHPEWRELFEGRNVYLFPDIDRKEGGDKPGERMAQEIADSLENARIIKLPEPGENETKMDVNSCYLRYGAEEIRRRAGI